jgi:hypothetical protein
MTESKKFALWRHYLSWEMFTQIRVACILSEWRQGQENTMNRCRQITSLKQRRIYWAMKSVGWCSKTRGTTVTLNHASILYTRKQDNKRFNSRGGGDLEKPFPLSILIFVTLIISQLVTKFSTSYGRLLQVIAFGIMNVTSTREASLYNIHASRLVDLYSGGTWYSETWLSCL